MTNINKLILCRHPKDFSNIQLALSGHRDLYRISPNGGDTVIEYVTPEVITWDHMKAKLEEVGLEFVDHSVDPETGMEVLRLVVLHHGVNHHFVHRFDTLYKHALDDMLACIEHTRYLPAEADDGHK